MHSTVCTVCQIKTDNTKQNTKKCFRLTIRPDFAHSLTAVVQGSSAAEAELQGRTGDGGNGASEKGHASAKCIFLFGCEWETKLLQDQLLTSTFRAGLIETQACLTL